MNGQRLTDAQISQALRAHLPDRAWSGMRERILESTATTPQQRALPSFLGVLSDADPVARRRSLLIAAALLVAVAVASAAAVGALRLFQRDPIPDLSLERPADLYGARRLDLRSAARAAAPRPDVARRLGQRPHLRRSVGGGPIRSVHVSRGDRAIQLHDPERPPRERDGDRRYRQRLGRSWSRGHRRGPAGVHPNRTQPRRRTGVRDGGIGLEIHRRRVRRGASHASRRLRRRPLDRRRDGPDPAHPGAAAR